MDKFQKKHKTVNGTQHRLMAYITLESRIELNGKVSKRGAGEGQISWNNRVRKETERQAAEECHIYSVTESQGAEQCHVYSVTE